MILRSSRIHPTKPMDGHWKFRGDKGSQKPKFLKQSTKLNWNFWKGWGRGFEPKKKGTSTDIIWNHTLVVLFRITDQHFVLNKFSSPCIVLLLPSSSCIFHSIKLTCSFYWIWMLWWKIHLVWSLKTFYKRSSNRYLHSPLIPTL